MNFCLPKIGWKKITVLLNTGSSNTFIQKQFLENIENEYMGKDKLSMSASVDQKK